MLDRGERAQRATPGKRPRRVRTPEGVRGVPGTPSGAPSYLSMFQGLRATRLTPNILSRLRRAQLTA
jgi:hypothetical protein